MPVDHVLFPFPCRNPSCRGTGCPSSRTLSRTCNTGRCCPVNCLCKSVSNLYRLGIKSNRLFVGEVNNWGSWGSCSGSCGSSGTQYRQRSVRSVAYRLFLYCALCRFDMGSVKYSRQSQCGGSSCGSLLQQQSCRYF